MIKRFLASKLKGFGAQFDYDTAYMTDILQEDLGGFIKFALFQQMGTHRRQVPLEPWYAAKLRTIIAEDCGPCTQLVVNMAIAEGVAKETVHAIVCRELSRLDAGTSLAVRFTEACLAHAPQANDLRDEVVGRWGHRGLVTLAFAISSTRVYPTLKYVLGHGQACERVRIGDEVQVPAAGGMPATSA